MSIDIDLFSEADYGTLDYAAIEDYLKQTFSYVSGDFGMMPALGKTYLIGVDQESIIKLDAYYSNDPFFQPFIETEGIRMATIEEIIAMKVDIVQRIGRKKDFWDLHEALPDYDINRMIDLHAQRSEYTHKPDIILENFSNFSIADTEPDPDCLRKKEWALIKDDLINARDKAKAII